jgi:hypothetical protein
VASLPIFSAEVDAGMADKKKVLFLQMIDRFWAHYSCWCIAGG